MNEEKLGEVCPACGVPRVAFEPYTETISKKRARILALNLHPITLHFPQAFAAAIPPFILLGAIAGPVLGHLVMSAVRVLAALLPLTVLAAAACGLIDGRTRFKKLTTPLLVRKMTGAAVLFLLSAAVAAVAVLLGTDYPGRFYLFLLSAACMVCEIYLAEIGKTIMNAKLPG
jgi:hypothetical protein